MVAPKKTCLVSNPGVPLVLVCEGALDQTGMGLEALKLQDESHGPRRATWATLCCKVSKMPNSQREETATRGIAPKVQGMCCTMHTYRALPFEMITMVESRDRVQAV